MGTGTFEWVLRSFVVGRGRPGVVRLWEARDHDALSALYAAFGGEDVRPGPPRGDAERRAWLERLEGGGINAVASVDGAVAGHAILLPEGDACELAVFVHPAFRRLGLAREMTAGILAFAGECGIGAVWSRMDGWDPAWARLAARFGFAPGEDGRWWRAAPKAPLAADPGREAAAAR